MIFSKFHENWLIIDREINEKHALLVSCGLRYITKEVIGEELCRIPLTVIRRDDV